jgi:hypothetical protein
VPVYLLALVLGLMLTAVLRTRVSPVAATSSSSN